MPKLESAIQKEVRLEASRLGLTMFRNNTGMAYSREGTPIKYGLCKGSSDLVGWESVVITPDMVGQTVAVFTAIEVKTPKGRPTKEQKRFIAAVNKAGGIGYVARCAEDVKGNQDDE